MTGMARKIGRVALVVLVALVTVLSGAWGALALWYQLPVGTTMRAVISVLWVLAILALLLLAAIQRSWWPLLGYVAAYALLLGWWATIKPSNDRIWSDDVAQLLTGKVEGNQVTLSNVRNFTWRSDENYDIHWETRRYDLDHLSSADAVLSYWGSPAIAHAMISFGFDDGRHIVFSVEIRKERSESYSPIGGFFRQFETILVAADEHDIIRVRTNVRNEDDYLYPLRMDKRAMRELFLSYVREANELAEKPEFYNTLTSNCTTIVYRMAKQISPGLPRDHRLLLTGYLPGYLYDVGVVDRSMSLEQLREHSRITERARQSGPDDDFSLSIRAGGH